jgi:hypothetical protein
VQPHAAPVGGRQQRRVDLLERRSARRVVIVDQSAVFRFARRVGAVFNELFRRQRVGTGDRFSGHRAFCAAAADAVLHACHLARMPTAKEIAQDAAVPAELAIIVGCTLPNTQGGEMRRLERADIPLIHCVI